MQDSVAIQLALSIRQAEEGVEYHHRYGAVCPWCGERLRVMDTKGWQAGVRLRYQRCINPKCPISVMDKSIKSIESE